MTVTVNSEPPIPTPGASPSPHAGRIFGLDLARGLAILGMVIVNFELALEASDGGPDWLVAWTGALQGRAAGTFVVLAGVGASLGSARARLSGNAELQRKQQQNARWQLLKRALFLFVLGTAFLTIWPADILHFYGVYLAIGATLLFAARSWIAVIATIATGAGLTFLALGNWDAHWNFSDLTYRDLWTPGGFFRNLFFDGWHPVLPWVTLYLAGMLVGRTALRERSVRARLFFPSLAVWAMSEILANVLAPQGIESEDWHALFATGSFPPTPAYLIAATSLAIAVITACCEACIHLPKWATRPMEAAGQMALTLYVAHVIVGLGTLEALGRLEGQSLPFAVGCALAFVALAMVFAVLWLKRFKRGPLEALMRRVCG